MPLTHSTSNHSKYLAAVEKRNSDTSGGTYTAKELGTFSSEKVIGLS